MERSDRKDIVSPARIGRKLSRSMPAPKQGVPLPGYTPIEFLTGKFFRSKRCRVQRSGSTLWSSASYACHGLIASVSTVRGLWVVPWAYAVR